MENEFNQGRFFKNYRVYGNKNAWETKITFGNELEEINKQMVLEGRAIILILDNFSGHFIEEEFSNVTVLFIAANMTAICQPLDMGCIANIKQGLGSFVNGCLVDNIELNCVDKIKKLVELHYKLSERLIKFCWEKAGLLVNEKQLNTIPICPEDELFDDIDQEIELEDEAATEEDDVIIIEPVPVQPPFGTTNVLLIEVCRENVQGVQNGVEKLQVGETGTKQASRLKQAQTTQFLIPQ